MKILTASGREREDHNKKAEWIDNMEKELEIHKECPKVEIPIDWLKAIQ